MLHQGDVGLLAMVIIILLCSRAYSDRAMRKHASTAQRYKFYRVRDDLVYLVATEKLKEDDLIFRTFYEAANYYIGAIDTLTLSRFVTAMVEARKKGLDPADKKKVEEILTALHSKDKEVVDAVTVFFRAVISILVENSLMLRVFLKFRFLAWLLDRFAEITMKIKAHSIHRRAYWFYQDNVRAISLL